MKYFLILPIILFPACSADVSHGDIQRAYKDCQNNGGLVRMESDVDMYVIKVQCKNSATFTYDSSNKEKYVNES